MNPKYQITRRDHKNQHLYSIVGDDECQDMSSVTFYTNIISKELTKWAAKMAAESMRKDLARIALDCAAQGEVVGPVRMSWKEVEDMIARAAEAPEKIKNDAADYGTMTHAACDHYIRHGEFPDHDPAIKPALDSFLVWWGTGRKIILGDTFVASKRYKFGGAFDAIEERADGIWIVDLKSSNNIWPEMAVQVGGGYTIAFEETFGMPAAGATILRLGKSKPAFESRDIANVSIAQSAFLAARTLREALSMKTLFVRSVHGS